MRKIFSYAGIMFVLYLGDAMIADFVPGFLQEILGSPLLMGLVLASSSLAGLILDVLFAKILPGAGVKKMLSLGILGAIVTVGLLALATYYPWLAILALSMVSWGLFYNMFSFANQRYVAKVAHNHERAAVWAVLGAFQAVAYGLGPLLLAYVAVWGDRATLLVMTFLFILGLAFLTNLKIRRVTTGELPKHHRVSVWQEIKHWRSLIAHIWPIVVLGVVLGLVDAMYWTTGTIVNDQLAEIHPLGGFFMTSYMLSTLIAGLLMSRREIRSGKKKLAEIMVLCSGLVLMLMTLFNYWWWYLLVVLISSTSLAMAWPLLNAVYTDLMSRMGGSEVHMIGLKDASHSVGYIFGPILAGLIATWVSEIKSFSYMGMIMVVVAMMLLWVTPKKIHLPQKEMASWD